MIVVAFVALILTVLIQGILLRRAAVEKQNEMAAAQQRAALAQAAYKQWLAAALQSRERGTAGIERIDLRATMEKFAKLLERSTADLTTKETRGGFTRLIKELEPRSDETDRQGSENE